MDSRLLKGAVDLIEFSEKLDEERLKKACLQGAIDNIKYEIEEIDNDE